MNLSTSRKKASIAAAHKIRLGVLLAIAFTVAGGELLSRNSDNAHGMYQHSGKCRLTASEFGSADNVNAPVSHSFSAKCANS